MRKVFIILMVFIITSTFAYAKNYGMAGCGLGSMIIKEDGFVQVFAATTNGTSYSQTFGITSGTSNCTKDGAVQSEREKEAFIETSMAELTTDISRGEGEYITTLASLYGCDKNVTPKLFSTLKGNFEEISKASDAQTMLSTLNRVIASDAELSKACTNL
ncbi:MAG: DUF3015 domain-containing protein [Deltaproteobacteria bacterium]|nr:DUF3015 domain-containing protein [Deltaproteobacteria bacterium]